MPAGENVVVFGGAGFLGSHLADQLSARGHHVTVFDPRPSPWLQDDQRQIFGDVRSAEQVRRAVKGMDAAFNCAAVAHVNQAKHEPRLTMDVNVMGHLTVLEACGAERSMRHIVYASSMYSVSRHGSFYRVSKVAAEGLTEVFAQQNAMTFMIARLGSRYGERSDDLNPNTIYRLVKQAIETGEMRYDSNFA